MDDSGQQTMGDPSLTVVAPMGGAPMMEDSVPLSALASADESNSMELPAVGDRVSYSVDGKLVRIEGDRAFIKKESVNGQDVTNGGAGDDEAAEGETGPDSIDKLTQDASAMDDTGAGQGY